jgi:hypothetical protein
MKNMEYFDRIRYEKINESMREICTPLCMRRLDTK